MPRKNWLKIKKMPKVEGLNITLDSEVAPPFEDPIEFHLGYEEAREMAKQLLAACPRWVIANPAVFYQGSGREHSRWTTDPNRCVVFFSRGEAEAEIKKYGLKSCEPKELS